VREKVTAENDEKNRRHPSKECFTLRGKKNMQSGNERNKISNEINEKRNPK